LEETMTDNSQQSIDRPSNERLLLIERYFDMWLHHLAAGRGEFRELRWDAFQAGWSAREMQYVISTPSAEIYEPVGYQYLYFDPISGHDIWRHDNTLWNFQRSRASRQIYVRPAEKANADPDDPGQCCPTCEQFVCVCAALSAKANPRHLTEPEREVLGRAAEASVTVIDGGSKAFVCACPVTGVDCIRNCASTRCAIAATT
jgi:hypothetical protein